MAVSRIIAFAACLALLGCASAPQTTRVRADDFDEVTSRIGKSLRGAPLIGARDAGSERWVIAMNKAQNLSSDVISESERWYLLERVKSSLPVMALAQEKNLVFVIAAEHLEGAREASGEAVGMERAPTHELAATFRSVTRRAGLHRTDAYMVEYRLTEIGTGAQVWADEFEFKRAAMGRSWD